MNLIKHRSIFLRTLLCLTFSFSLTTYAEETNQVFTTTIQIATAKAKPDAEAEAKAAEWTDSLKLEDTAESARVKEVIATHLKTIHDWHNEHPYTSVPAGINPITGKPLSQLDRQIIANSAIPKSVHSNLMAGLRQDLSETQVEAILDKYTVGKVAFTMNGYRAIVPDLTTNEATTIEGYLKQAREEAVDYKSMNQISAIFEIYKTKSEQYLNSNGRSWKQLYKTYTDEIKAKKAAQKAALSPALTNNTAK